MRDGVKYQNRPTPRVSAFGNMVIQAFDISRVA